ncbi:MAG: M56 family metallopeptidase [Firmicutes bacterium]|nr:M56 family metallopeptidase [Bacillota bacterium]
MRSGLRYLFSIQSQYWISSMWSALCQGSLALIVVWALSKAFPRIPARTRCWLWRLGLAKLLLQLFEAPQINLAVLPRARTVLALVVSDCFAENIPTRGQLSRNFGGPLMVLWIAGITLSLVSVLIALVRAYYMARHTVSIHSEEPNTFLYRLCNQMGITSQPRLVTVGWASTPMTLRMDRRCVVVVPEELLLPNRREDLQLVLAHELAHVKRRDLAWNWLHTIVKALFFFNPLVWVAGRELRITQEMACDEMAVRATCAEAARYGKTLLTMIRPSHGVGPMWEAASTSASSSARVMQRRLLELKHIEDSPTTKILASIATLLLICLLVIPFQIVEAPRNRAPTLEISKVKDQTDISVSWILVRTARSDTEECLLIVRLRATETSCSSLPSRVRI